MQPRLLLLFLSATAFLGRLAASAGDVTIDPARSRVEVAVKATMDSFVGHLTKYDATITLADDASITGARFAFHFRDLVTGKESRDKAMHTWQKTEEFPDGLFVLTALEPPRGASVTAFGRLTLHGITRELRFPVGIARDDRRYTIDGDAPIDVREFGLPIVRMLGLLKVDPVVHVRFHLQGVRETPTASQP